MEKDILLQVCGHHCSETPAVLPALCTEVLYMFLPHIAKESEGLLGCYEVFMFPAGPGKHLYWDHNLLISDHCSVFS